MPANCRKYKTSGQHIRQTEPAYLASFLEKQQPGAQFRFITLEHDDYRKACMTFLLCKSVPEKIIISVEHSIDLEPAIARVITLNPSVVWDSVDFIYPFAVDPVPGKFIVELWFGGLPASVDTTGKLNRVIG